MAKKTWGLYVDGERVPWWAYVRVTVVDTVRDMWRLVS